MALEDKSQGFFSCSINTLNWWLKYVLVPLMKVHLVLQVYGLGQLSQQLISSWLSLITEKDLGPASRFGVSGYRTGSFFQHSGDSCCHLLLSLRCHHNIQSCWQLLNSGQCSNCFSLSWRPNTVWGALCLPLVASTQELSSTVTDT